MTRQPKKSRSAQAYERHREAMAERSAVEARAGQDIGDIPPVVDPKRRRACGRSLAVFCRTYLKHIFFLPWSPCHKKVIRKAERAVTEGGLFAVAMPRGYGKTSICEAAVLWGILYAYRRFPFFIGAEQSKALESLETIKIELQTNDLLLEDFPEVVYPFRALEGISNRCRGQRFDGELTHIRWTNDTIVVATIPGSKASGAVIRVAGITGSIRGQKHNPPGGAEPIRPDLVMIDDGQTRESAGSPAQVRKRLKTVQGDVLKLGGPGRKIACLMPCTVIEPEDMADQLLDMEKNPDWQGERIAMLESMPTRMDLWEEYDRIRRACLQDGADISAATRFYRKHRKAMDLGAKPTWPHYFEPGEISNVQHAMNWYFKAPAAFFSECQNDPLPAQDIPSDALKAQDVMRRTNGRPRGEVPTWAVRLTCGIDVQDTLLPYLICAWAEDFTGAVIDYGTFPDQKKAFWTRAEATRTLGRAFPSAGFEGKIRAGLDALTAEVLGREWRRDDGMQMRIERAGIDANWGRTTDLVYNFCRESAFSSILLPAHGQAIGPQHKPWHEYEKRPGEQLGHHWRIRQSEGRAVRHLLIDTNYWKSFAQTRLQTPVGDRSALTLWGRTPDDHDLFAQHMISEFGTPTIGRGREVTVWELKAHRPDNDLWDCLVINCVLASIQGSAVPGAGMLVKKKKMRYWRPEDVRGQRGRVV